MIGELIVLLQWLISFLPYWRVIEINEEVLVTYAFPLLPRMSRVSRWSGLTWDLFITIHSFYTNLLPFESGTIFETMQNGETVSFEVNMTYTWVEDKKKLVKEAGDTPDQLVHTEVLAAARSIVARRRHFCISTIQDAIETRLIGRLGDIIEIDMIQVGSVVHTEPNFRTHNGMLELNVTNE